MLRLASGIIALVLLGGCEQAAGTSSSAVSSLASGSPSGSASAATGDVPRLADPVLAKRLREVAKGCVWSDDHGFAECKELDAALLPKLSLPQAFGTAELLLADADPRMRRVALSILDYSLAPSPTPMPPLSTSLAVIAAAQREAVPALDLHLAMTAAALPKSDELRAPLEKLLRSASVAKRAAALVFLSRGDADPPWVGDLLREASKDKDAEVRLAATRGLIGRFVSHHQETCKALVDALADQEVRVRDAARSALVGSVDVTLDDEKRGFLGARASPFSKPCDEAEVAAAYESIEKDTRAGKVSFDARALFHNGALLHLPWSNGAPSSPRDKEHRALAVKELTAIAKSAKAPLSARLTAIRGLRSKAAGDTQQTLADLAKDPDEHVAKAASAPSKP